MRVRILRPGAARAANIPLMHDQRAPGHSTAPAVGDAPPRILVVDDDDAGRRLVCISLEAAGFSVTGVASGEAALRAIAKKAPDVVVLDYEMPGLNGAEVCARIRASESLEISELPVIMLTAHTAEPDEIRCLEAGANDFVTKPVSRAVLQARIQTGLRLRAYARELEQWREVQEADLASARATQQAILPAKLPDFPGWQIEACHQPLIQVGGDIYGWELLRDGRWLFWLADGTGHGAAAALLTALTTHLFSKAAEGSSSPGEILDSVNHEFSRVAGGSTFMTAGCAALSANGEMHFASAGHPPLIVQRRGGAIESYSSERTLLGVGEKIGIADSMLHLADGDTAFIYTDGLYALKSKCGGHFGNEIVEQVLQNRPLGGDAIGDLMSRIAEQSDGSPADDDIAVIALRRIS